MRLALAIAALATGCYEPELASCKVTCGSAADCAGGDVCGTDGFCVGAASERCTQEAPIDAAGMTIQLHVMVMGNGSITVTGGGTCRDSCMYPFSPSASISATWVQTSGGHEFQSWTTPNCAQQGQTCTFVLSAATATLGAKFQ